jgi:membrane associated rhomboid family serine protease
MIPLKDDNPTQNTPFVTIGLIALNVIAFIYQMSQGQLSQSSEAARVIYQFGLVPSELTGGIEITPQAAFPAGLTIFSSMFLHGGLMHLGGNMLYLWIFGNNIEDRLGPIRFIFFYLLSGVFAVFLFVLTAGESNTPLIGASGAVAGVLGAYLLHYPRAKVLTLFTLGWFIRFIRVPAWVVLGFWFLIQIFFSVGSIGSAEGGGVAYMAWERAGWRGEDSVYSIELMGKREVL